MESLLQGVNQKWDSLMAGADTAGKVLHDGQSAYVVGIDN